MEMPDNTRFASAPSLPHPVFHQRESQTAKVIGLHFMPALATVHDGIVCSQFLKKKKKKCFQDLIKTWRHAPERTVSDLVKITHWKSS